MKYTYNIRRGKEELRPFSNIIQIWFSLMINQESLFQSYTVNVHVLTSVLCNIMKKS